MTLREYIGSGLPPAPEDTALRRLRLTTAFWNMTATGLFVLARLRTDEPFWLLPLAMLLILIGLPMIILLFVRRVRCDLDYWTPDRVALHKSAIAAASGAKGVA